MVCGFCKKEGHNITKCDKPGAQEKRKRRKEAREKKKKEGQETEAEKKMRGPSKCGFCHEEGHNVAKCEAPGAEDYRERKKNTPTAEFNRQEKEKRYEKEREELKVRLKEKVGEAKAHEPHLIQGRVSEAYAKGCMTVEGATQFAMPLFLLRWIVERMNENREKKLRRIRSTDTTRGCVTCGPICQHCDRVCRKVNCKICDEVNLRCGSSSKTPHEMFFETSTPSRRFPGAYSSQSPREGMPCPSPPLPPIHHPSPSSSSPSSYFSVAESPTLNAENDTISSPPHPTTTPHPNAEIADPVATRKRPRDTVIDVDGEMIATLRILSWVLGELWG